MKLYFLATFTHNFRNIESQQSKKQIKPNRIIVKNSLVPFLPIKIKILSWCRWFNYCKTSISDQSVHVILGRLTNVTKSFRPIWYKITPNKYYSLCHCVKSVHIWSFFGSYFPAFGLNTVQKNSECGHFSRSVLHSVTEMVLWNIITLKLAQTFASAEVSDPSQISQLRP